MANYKFSPIVIYLVTVMMCYELKCPSHSNWKERARTFCEEENQYTCLLDIFKNSSVENCIGPELFPTGRKAVMRHYLDIDYCLKRQYQPIIFSTSRQSSCLLLKSRCSEIGQLPSNIYQPSSRKDQSCVCDPDHGFGFLLRPRADVSCIPSEEDCSCVKGKVNQSVHQLHIVFKSAYSLEEKESFISQGITLYHERAYDNVNNTLTLVVLLLLPGILYVVPTVLDYLDLGYIDILFKDEIEIAETNKMRVSYVNGIKKERYNFIHLENEIETAPDIKRKCNAPISHVQRNSFQMKETTPLIHVKTNLQHLPKLGKAANPIKFKKASQKRSSHYETVSQNRYETKKKDTVYFPTFRQIRSDPYTGSVLLKYNCGNNNFPVYTVATDIRKRIQEETNFRRLCLLVQVVVSKAIRSRLDKESPSVSRQVGELIKKNKSFLIDLYWLTYLTKNQGELILPFRNTRLFNCDITTMICLFGCLPNNFYFAGSYHTLPAESDSSLGGDLARIMYYRNYFAQGGEEIRRINKPDFIIIWETLCKALVRIGGPQLENDSSNIWTVDIKNSANNIKDCLILQPTSHESHKLNFKATKPSVERGKFYNTFNLLEIADKSFTETLENKELTKVLLTHNVVIVRGKPHTNDSGTVQHILLALRNIGHDVIHVSSSTDILKHYSSNIRKIFFIDNMYDKYNFSGKDSEKIKQNRKTLSDIFASNTIKFVITCRLQVLLEIWLPETLS